jgi:hypothetical protein
VSTSAPILVRDRRLGAWDVLLLSAWCGLAGGLLEVVTRVVCRYVDPTNRLYMLSRHFVWLAPLSSFLLFSTVGLFLSLGTKLWLRRMVFCSFHLFLYFPRFSPLSCGQAEQPLGDGLNFLVGDPGA